MAKLGLIAGGGDLPRRLAEHVRASGRGVFVLALKGFADPGLAGEFDGAEAAMGQLGKGLRLLKQAGCEEVAFAGTVKRPDFSALQVDMRGAALLPEVLVAATKGDDAILRVVLGAFEKEGFKVVGADDVLAALLAPAGAIGRRAPGDADWIDIREAAREAARIGAADVGQGAVARGGRIVEGEKQDGTDAMLRRVAALGGHGGVLVKRPKPQQERRIDLPTIGMATVRGAAEAKLAGIAVEAGGALIVDRAAVAALADELGVFVYGFTAVEAG
ncbi:MAG TPA: UDP-2,3-diacylglucosamine diphosphatase LpxI [Hyphomonadaceae bacterium]|nr:UDP-2,3-diacylglucosamine diphosphatase LpxI [Hyphomonadaceae bacterium]